MRSFAIGLALAGLSLGVATAQTTPPNGAGTMTPGSSTASPGTTSTAPMGTAPAGTPPAGRILGNGGPAAASGNNNQAVATTSANAPQPAKGHNSFTQGQAKTRIGKQGYQSVSALKLDNNGVWHGTAQKDGQTMNVWLDYKGNIGTSPQ